MKYLFIPNKTHKIDTSINKIIREKFKYACALPFCKSSINTEIHHIVPRKEAKVRFHDVDYEPNLVLLCRQHHIEAEDGCITREYLEALCKYWELGLIEKKFGILKQRYDRQKKLFDSKKNISIGNINSFHEQIVYVNSVSLSRHIETFSQNLDLLDKSIDPESAFNYYFSFASTYRRHSTQTKNRRLSEARLLSAVDYLNKCEILVKNNGLNQEFINRVVYERAYVRYLGNDDIPFQDLSIYDDIKDSFSNCVNRYFLYVIRSEQQSELDLKNLERMHYYFQDYDYTFSKRWVFNSSTILVEKRILTNQFSDSDYYLIEKCVDFVDKEHFESSKSGVYKNKGMFYLKTHNYIDAATNLELSLSIARRFFSYEKISEIHYYLGLAYKNLELFEEADEQFRIGMKYGPSNNNIRGGANCKKGLISLEQNRIKRG